MASSEVYEDIFQTGLARGELFELGAVLSDGFKQSWDGMVRLFYG
jgi:hypothetical protein